MPRFVIQTVRERFQENLEMAKEDGHKDEAAVAAAVSWTTQEVVKLCIQAKNNRIARDNPGW